MQEIILTCPFTGVDFTAIVSNDGNVTFVNPLTDEVITVKDMPFGLFTHIETMTPAEVAEYLDISKQRVSQIIRDKVIPVSFVAGKPVFMRVDVERYGRKRKVGRPEKEGK